MPIERETRRAAQGFQRLSPGVANVDVTRGFSRIDKTLLLLLGQERDRVSVVVDKDNVSIAARFDSGLNFLELFELEGGMPTRVSLPRNRHDDALRSARRRSHRGRASMTRFVAPFALLSLLAAPALAAPPAVAKAGPASLHSGPASTKRAFSARRCAAAELVRSSRASISGPERACEQGAFLEHQGGAHRGRAARGGDLGPHGEPRQEVGGRGRGARSRETNRSSTSPATRVGSRRGQPAAREPGASQGDGRRRVRDPGRRAARRSHVVRPPDAARALGARPEDDEARPGEGAAARRRRTRIGAAARGQTGRGGRSQRVRRWCRCSAPRARSKRRPACSPTAILTTSWSEGRSSGGRGDFVLLKTPDKLPLQGVEFVFRPTAKEPAHATAPKQFFLASTKSVFRVAVPADAWQTPGARYAVTFDKPLADDCLAVVLDSALEEGPNAAVTFTELRARTEFESADPKTLVGALARRRKAAEAAGSVLRSLGTPGFEAVAERFGELDEGGRRVALDVIDAADCSISVPVYLRALGDEVEAHREHARPRLRRCGPAAAEGSTRGPAEGEGQGVPGARERARDRRARGRREDVRSSARREAGRAPQGAARRARAPRRGSGRGARDPRRARERSVVGGRDARPACEPWASARPRSSRRRARRSRGFRLVRRAFARATCAPHRPARCRPPIRLRERSCRAR